jgi:hypothetical protein
MPEGGAGAPRFAIVGTSRSGTTLVQRLADELPGVRVPPETHFFSRFALDLLGRRSFPLDAAALREELGRYLSIDSCRGLPLDVAAVVERLGGRCESVFSLFAAVVRDLAGEGALAGEKTPEHLLWWRPLSAAFPALGVVAVVRDPRAVVASNLQVPFGMASRATLAARWAADQRLVRAAAAALGSRCLVLRYEDVVADPDAARASLAGFLGVEGGDRVGEVAASDLYVGWETWKARTTDAITTERTTAWTSVLTPAQAETVAAQCREGMAAFGYDGAPSGAGAVLARLRLPPAEQLRLRRYRAGRRKLEADIAAVEVTSG